MSNSSKIRRWHVNNHNYYSDLIEDIVDELGLIEYNKLKPMEEREDTIPEEAEQLIEGYAHFSELTPPTLFLNPNLEASKWVSKKQNKKK